MKLARVLALSAVVAALTVAPAAAFTVVSESSWGTAGSETARGVAVAPDGSIYQAVTAFDLGNFPPTLILLKYAADGTLLWEQAWEVPGSFFTEDAADVAVASDGSVYVVGSANGDALILKFSPDGTLLWQRTWGETGSDAAQDVAIAPDGTVVVSGTTRSFGAGEEDSFVITLTPAGDLVWQRTWGTVNNESDTHVAVGADGTIFMTTTTLRPSGLFEFDAILVRLDAAGNLLSQTAVSAGEVLDARGGVVVAPDGSVYVAGGIQEPKDGLDTILLKFNSTGTLVWGRRWGGRSGEDPGALTIGPDGTVYVIGTTDSFGAGGGGDAFVLSVTPDGRGIDAATWGGTSLDNGRGIALTSGGTLALSVTANTPPWTLGRASTRLSRLRATTATAGGVVTVPTDVLQDAAGVTFTPGGSTTYAGGFDAALVLLQP